LGWQREMGGERNIFPGGGDWRKWVEKPGEGLALERGGFLAAHFLGVGSPGGISGGGAQTREAKGVGGLWGWPGRGTKIWGGFFAGGMGFRRELFSPGRAKAERGGEI